MKRWKQTTLAALVLWGLLAGILAASASTSTETIYLMAVNERVLDVTVDNMPRTVGGVLYVPYTMLPNRASGVNLGVSALYSTTRRTVLVTDDRRGIIFDLQNNTAADLDGVPVQVRAMVRNNTVFLPIDWLCQYFGTIGCTRTWTPYGILVRLTSSAAILSDRDFIDAADGLLADSLRRYLESGVRGEGNGPPPSGDPAPSADLSGTELYLALGAGASAQDCAQLLESRGQRALFLFSPEELPGQGGLVRRVVGAGHTAGLSLSGEDVDSCLAQAEEGRSLLAAAARYNALVVSAPNLDAKGRKALEEAGYVVWTATVRGERFSSGGALIRELDPRRMNYVEIMCGSGGAGFLRSALGAMAEEDCQPYHATAPALADR